MSLKELTMQQHANAERQKFASVLMSGKIPKKSYLRYLFNQFSCYHSLENHDIFTLPNLELKRCNYIHEDICELKNDLGIEKLELFNIILTDSTLSYVNHVKKNIKTKDDFMAHVYVRYLGDLRGGQMIAKKIPGSGKYYNFTNPQELAQSIYMHLNDDMAEEAKKVFNFATKLFIEMYTEMVGKNEINF